MRELNLILNIPIRCARALRTPVYRGVCIYIYVISQREREREEALNLNSVRYVNAEKCATVK